MTIVTPIVVKTLRSPVHEDIQKRIPRAEITEARERILELIASISASRVIGEVAGSYRRGAETSGDVDLILTSNDWKGAEESWKARKGFLVKLKALLWENGILTDDLAGETEPESEYMRAWAVSIVKVLPSNPTVLLTTVL